MPHEIEYGVFLLRLKEFREALAFYGLINRMIV